METAAVRLKRLREAAQPALSVRALAEELGMPASTYAFYEDPKKFKKAYAPVEFVRSLVPPLTKRNIAEQDVLALAGVAQANDDHPSSDPGDLTPTERAMLRIIRNATEEQVVAVADYMRGRVDAIDASAAAAQQLDAVLLPEIDVGYSMGGGADIDDYPVTQLVPFSRAWLSSLTRTPASQLFVARGEGDSMMPTILDQDIVIIDRSERAPRSQDRIWAVSYGGLGMIKRIRMLPSGALQINSDNPAVTPIEAYDGEAHIIGRVVGIIRRV